MHSRKQIFQTQHPEVTEMLDLWVSKAMADRLLLTGKVLCQKWTTFADFAGIPEDEHLTLSGGWLTCFKTQNGLKQIKHHGKAASIVLDTVDKEQVQIQKLIEKENYQL